MKFPRKDKTRATHANVQGALRDFLIEADLHGMSETETARLLFGAAWTRLRCCKPHGRAMEHFQTWLDDLDAHPELGGGKS